MPTIDYEICLAQATAGAETWIPISTLGGSGLQRQTITCGMDYVTFKVNGSTAFTDDSVFAYHAKVRVRQVVDGTPSYYFVGRVATIPRHATGTAESYDFRIEGPWSWFQATTLRQPWAAAGGGISKPRVILFCDQSGNRITTGAQIIAAAEFARLAGAPIAPVTSATVAAGFTPPFDEQINIKCADVVTKALANHPHAVIWFDYSQRDAVFHCDTRQALPAVSRSIAGRRDILISQRNDMQAPAIAICYEQSGSVDSSPVVNTTLDYAPVISGESTLARDARLSQADVMWACYSLQGASVTTVSQLIEAAAFPVSLNNLAWWQARLPWLSELDPDDITITGAERLGDSTLSNLLVQGALQTWMSTASIETERIRADISFVRRGVVNGVNTVIEQGTKSEVLEVQVTGAAIGQTLYRQPVSIDEGEPVPVGIAAQLYNEWSQLHFQGTIVFRNDSAPGDLVPGHALNLTGGRDEWLAMAAMIIRCSEDADNGETTVEFGVPSWTDVDSRVAFAKATRSRNPATSRVYQTGATADGVTGNVTPAVVRDGSVDAAYVRQVFTGTGSPCHLIVIDANQIIKSDDEEISSVIQPREVLLPFIDEADGYKLKAAAAQVMASAPYGDAISLEGADLAASAPPAIDATGAVGTATKAAREDHTHAGVTLTAASPAAVAASAAVGTATEAARADHAHAGVMLATQMPSTVNGFPAVGTSPRAAKEDHAHSLSITLPDPGPATGAPTRDGGDVILPAPGGSLGISGYYARRDHVHPVNVDDTALPADNAATAAPGTSNRYARADHVHVGQAAALETVAPVADGVATVGVSTKGAHGDHRHPLNVDATVPPADSGSGSAGSASTYPRRDHAHPLNVDATAPATLGTANAAGSASVYARRDHVHADRVPTSVPSPVNFAFADENGNANSAASWVAGGSAGVTISVVTRVRYTETDGTPAIYAYYRNLTFDVFGRLYSQSTEGWYVVDAPVTLSV